MSGSRIHKKVIIAGETPKLMVSARLSNSAPNGVNAFSNRADKPLIISKHAATSIQKTAFCQLPSRANRIPVNPEHKPTVVKMLGSNFASEIFFGFSFSSLFTHKNYLLACENISLEELILHHRNDL